MSEDPHEIASTIPGWATRCRAFGAPGFLRSIGNLPVVTHGQQLAIRG
jgi:hypothetical protein